MKKKIICNHKMFLDIDKASSFKKEMQDIDLSGVDLILCPSYTNFYLFKDFNLCAQDCFYEDIGPYTGEISCFQLKQMGIKYSLVGHCYRRKYDTDKVINLKIKSLIKNNVMPILCIGEYKKDYFFRTTKNILKKQIKNALQDITLLEYEKIIIAYEPVWTIGSNMVLSKERLNETIGWIKSILYEMNIEKYEILYGGSINAENIENFLNCNIDGFLLGRASVDMAELKKIIDYTKKCK